LAPANGGETDDKRHPVKMTTKTSSHGQGRIQRRVEIKGDIPLLRRAGPNPNNQFVRAFP
jgi:hypothetical protein